MGIVLVSVVKISGILSYLQEAKSNDLINSFKKLMPQQATVIRNGLPISIDMKNIVVGDLVLLKPGDITPADLRIIESHGLKIDNSTLTGESEPQSISATSTNERFIESKNLAFYSTHVVEGKKIQALSNDMHCLVRNSCNSSYQFNSQCIKGLKA